MKMEMPETCKDYSTLDDEFFAIVRAATYLQYYLAPEVFEDTVLNFDSEALKQTNVQQMLEHDFGVLINHGADALSRHHTPLSMTQVTVLGSEDEKKLYGD